MSTDGVAENLKMNLAAFSVKIIVPFIFIFEKFCAYFCCR